MTTEWFVRQPGDLVSPSVDDPKMAIVGCDVPDWVRLPPELDGAQLRVLGHHEASCPKCSAGNVTHLELQDRYGVAECTGCGFVWYRTNG